MSQIIIFKFAVLIFYNLRKIYLYITSFRLNYINYINALKLREYFTRLILEWIILYFSLANARTRKHK